MKKMLILNGSARKNGNTAAALKAIGAGAAGNCQVEWIDAVKLKIYGCIGCDGCKKNGGTCVLPDGTAEFMEKVAAADVIVFGSPVYWWGISAQLKGALDKFYSKDEAFHTMKKKIGVVAVGAAGLEDPEYRLIADQFKCIADYLGWEVIFSESIAAHAVGELAGNAARLTALMRLGSSI